MSIDEWVTLLALATAMSFTPGPNTTLSAALAANAGLRAALRFIVAVPVGWTLMMVAAGYGLGALLLAAPPLRIALTAAGVLYMLWLAWKLAHSAQLGQANGRMDIGFLQGVLLQFVNIKAWMLALTLASGWVLGGIDRPLDHQGQRLAQVCAVMLVFAFASNLSYALVGSVLRRWLSEGRRLLWFNRTMALVLVVTALWMLRL